MKTDKKQLFQWFSQELLKKAYVLNDLQQLANGNLFIDLISIYHPSKVDLTKVYIKPKDNYQVLQNFKHLSSVFSKLGWKKIDSEKYTKKLQKNYLSLATYIMNTLTSHIISQAKKQLNINQTQNFNLNKTLQNFKTKTEYSQNKKKTSLMETMYLASCNSKNQIKNTQRKVNLQAKNQKYQENQKIQNKSHKQRQKNIKNMSQVLNKNKNKQEFNFQNIKITKLQKQKAVLLNKIMMIQNILTNEKNNLKNKNSSKKNLEQEKQKLGKNQHQSKIERIQIQRVKTLIKNAI